MKRRGRNWHAPEIRDNLIAGGRSKPMILVMTNGNGTQSASQSVVPLQVPPGRPGEEEG